MLTGCTTMPLAFVAPEKRLMTRPVTVVPDPVIVRPLTSPAPVPSISICSTALLPTARVLALAPGWL